MSQCDSPTSGYEEDWLNFTVPYKNSAWDACHRYAVNATSNVSSLPFTEPSGEYCAQEYFTNRTESCGHDFKFRDEENTISTEVSGERYGENSN